MSSQISVPLSQLPIAWSAVFAELTPSVVLPRNGAVEAPPSRPESWESSGAAVRRSNREPRTGNWQLPGVVPASRLGDRPRPAMAASGVAAVDALCGGLPRGALTEICGPASSGRTSLLLAAMAQATARGEVVALVDANDCFDPASAEAAGVELKRVLWVRCRQQGRMPNADCRMETCKQSAIGIRQSALRKEYSAIEQALKAADLLLQAGGFGMVIVDFGDVPEQVARRVPLTSWFRFRRAVEHTDTVLLAVTREACAKSCASLVLRLTAGRLVTGAEAPSNNDAGVTGLKPGASTVVPGASRAPGVSTALPGTSTGAPVHARLLHGLEIRAEVLRDAVQGKKPVQSAARFATQTEWKRNIG